MDGSLRPLIRAPRNQSDLEDNTVAIRTARSRISNGYLPGHRCCDMAPSVMVNRFPGACQIDKGASDSPAMSGRKPLPVRTSTNWQFRGAGLRATEALPWRGARAPEKLGRESVVRWENTKLGETRSFAVPIAECILTGDLPWGCC